MRFVCFFWIIGLHCCFAQERSPFESGLEPVGLSLSLHCFEWLGTLHSTTLGISTIFSIALCLVTSSSGSFPCCWVCSFACGWLCSFTFLGSGVPSLAVFSFESIHACTACARHRRRCPRGHRSRSCEALFPRASRPTSLTSSLRSCTVVLLCHRGLLVHDSNLFLAVVCRTSATSDSTSAVVTALA